MLMYIMVMSRTYRRASTSNAVTNMGTRERGEVPAMVYSCMLDVRIEMPSSLCYAASESFGV